MHLYFCVIGLLLFLGHLIIRHRNVALPGVAASVILALTLIPAVFKAPHFVGVLRNPWTSRTEQVHNPAGGRAAARHFDDVRVMGISKISPF